MRQNTNQYKNSNTTKYIIAAALLRGRGEEVAIYIAGDQNEKYSDNNVKSSKRKTC